MNAQDRTTLKSALQAFQRRVLKLTESHDDVAELLRQVQRGLERALIPHKIL